jgi:hypothetical protein
MTNVQSTLAKLFEPVPQALSDYFDALAKRSAAGEIAQDLNLLPAKEAVKLTRIFLEFHPVLQALNGFVLDDPGTSDHHFYLNRPPFKGMVLFLAHDGGTRVVYRSLAEFIEFAQKATEFGQPLEDMHPAQSPLADDQAALSAFATELLEDGEQGDVLTAIIPSMDLGDEALLRRLAEDEDFYLGEAVAIEIEKRPSAALLQIAELCAQHPHSQVADAGQRTCKAIKRITAKPPK